MNPQDYDATAPWGSGESVSGTWDTTPPYFDPSMDWGSFDPGGDAGIWNTPSNSGLPDWLKGVLGIGRSPTSADIGRLGGAGLGYLGAQEQQRMFQHLADRYWGMGAPYRQRLENTYADPMAWLRSPEVQGPVQQGSDIMARSLSMQGNPAQSGNALQQLQNYSSNQLFGKLGDYRNQLGRLGGMENQTGAVTGATGKAIESVGNQYNAFGSGMNSIFNPPPAYPQRASDSGLGDIGQLIGIAGGLSSIFSDRRLKSNIVKVGDDPRGFGIYEYDIFGKRERGVIADEVEAIIPEAVTTILGYKAVDYARL